MVDNLENIKYLLTFDTEDDFYFLQILQRKKDNPGIGSNSKVIKNYYIDSIEYLENKYDEIKQLCNIFNARASLRLNKRSYEKVAFKSIENMANHLRSRDYKYIAYSYDKACGQLCNKKDKKWLIDFDFEVKSEDLEKYINIIDQIDPIREKKYIATIPSKNGFHLITKPFNMEMFKIHFPSLDVHKDNPVNLYIP